jgi:hypothetical protein
MKNDNDFFPYATVISIPRFIAAFSGSKTAAKKVAE